ncbi:uncharacterized protein G2W53_004004 [Senna tora]|uniref:Uncharacterized protein n=1 Tax=Senna tora TaxID=362788 RepID=A0A835CG89_9FABA|nr:uncharacterized protein G2W53_004004 [Senna tora]
MRTTATGVDIPQHDLLLRSISTERRAISGFAWLLSFVRTLRIQDSVLWVNIGSCNVEAIDKLHSTFQQRQKTPSDAAEQSVNLSKELLPSCQSMAGNWFYIQVETRIWTPHSAHLPHTSAPSASARTISCSGLFAEKVVQILV